MQIDILSTVRKRAMNHPWNRGYPNNKHLVSARVDSLLSPSELQRDEPRQRRFARELMRLAKVQSK